MTVGKIITHKFKPRYVGLPRGWFAIAGQTGAHTLDGRLIGLTPLDKLSRDVTILDLGCAEGLIGLRLLQLGPARLLHGVDIHSPYLQMARGLARAQPKARFFHLDLNHLDDLADWLPTLRPSYDIVLCLCIAHKMRDPAAFLRRAARLCSGYLALQLPSVVIDDRRSDHRPLNTHEWLGVHGFKLFHQVDDDVLVRRIYRRHMIGAGPTEED